MTDRWDRSYARAQASYDAREAPCEDTCPECQGGGRVDCETCDGTGAQYCGCCFCHVCEGRGSVPCKCKAGDLEVMADYREYLYGDEDNDISF